ncbi:MAG: hypothetical protein QOJ79_3531 [Actinomycetota bacterium]|jgi:hypothetical protein|nr:hypothetical protein [Actinomycetota bacterium]
MHRRAAAFGAALALTAGGGVASAAGGHDAAPVGAAAVTGADVPVSSVRWERQDLRSSQAVLRAYRATLSARAARLNQGDEGFFVYGGVSEAVPIHDVDGDRADDVLEVRAAAAKGPAVALRSGRTGREKWVAPTDSLAAVEYVPVPGGHPLVLTYALTEDGEDAFLAFVGTTTLTVQAFDASTGALSWSADWNGAETFSPAAATLVGLAFPGGVLTARRGQHPTLLIDSFDEVITDASDTLRSHVQYVDLLTGKATGTTVDVDGDAAFSPVGDLDADGTADVVEVAASGSIAALSGVDAHQVWAAKAAQQFDLGSADAAADMTGDGRADVFVAMGTFDDQPGYVAALDGRTGKQLWQRTAAGARSIGDIDRDGRSETRLITYVGSAVRYTAVNSRGRTLWSTTVTPTVPRTSALSWLAGDLDADGIQDSYVRLVDRSEPGGSGGKASFVVNGRTGRIAQHPDWGIPLAASIDGRGDDFARTSTVLTNGAQRVLMSVVDGRTGRATWQRQVPVESSATLADVWGGDFTGTGRTDVLSLLTEPDRAVVVVQNGRTGGTSWSGGYDARRDLKPF